MEEFHGIHSFIHSFIRPWTDGLISALLQTVSPSSMIFRSQTVKEDGSPTVVYVPSHLYHMVFELFKVKALDFINLL